MQRKSWFIPILVFLFSFSVLSFYQKSQSAVTLAKTAELPPVLWSMTTSDISKVNYSIGTKQIIATCEDDEWYLSNFNNKKADCLYIYTTINKFLDPKFESIISTSPQDLTEYGIDDSSATLTLYDHNQQEYKLIQGSAFNDELTYVYVPMSDTIYTMKADLFKPLSINLEDWITKELLSFNLEEVSKITFSYKGLETTLNPTATNHGITFSSDNLNSTLSEKFVGFLQNSNIRQFITTNADEHILDVYGFSNPSLDCTIYLTSGESLSLKIGMINKAENICYAVVNDNGTIVAIPYFDFSQFDALFAELEASNALTLG